MLYSSLALNVVLLVVLCWFVYLHWDGIKTFTIINKNINEIRQVTAKRSNPVCPVCKNEFVGRVMYSASGHACCQTCLVTVFGNK